jgi:hypothetical protein
MIIMQIFTAEKHQLVDSPLQHALEQLHSKMQP